MLEADDGFALGELIAAEERAFLALADYELALLALVTRNLGRLGRRLGGDDVAGFVKSERGLAVRIITAA